MSATSSEYIEEWEPLPIYVILTRFGPWESSCKYGESQSVVFEENGVGSLEWDLYPAVRYSGSFSLRLTTSMVAALTFALERREVIASASCSYGPHKFMLNGAMTESLFKLEFSDSLFPDRLRDRCPGKTFYSLRSVLPSRVRRVPQHQLWYQREGG
jgi:hypothetical protein